MVFRCSSCALAVDISVTSRISVASSVSEYKSISTTVFPGKMFDVDLWLLSDLFA